MMRKRTSDSSGEDSVIRVLGGEVGSSLGGKVLEGVKKGRRRDAKEGGWLKERSAFARHVLPPSLLPFPEQLNETTRQANSHPARR